MCHFTPSHVPSNSNSRPKFKDRKLIDSVNHEPSEGRTVTEKFLGLGGGGEGSKE